MDHDVPRTLCQPGRNKSCGSCCGMYNTRHHTQSQLTDILLRRTEAFSRTVQIDEPESLLRFRKQWTMGSEDTLLNALPVCPFLGFLDEVQAPDGPVGCLVHPTRHDGVDGRDCGVYSRDICEDYLCASHSLMTTDEKRLVIDAVMDSFLYGLIITDVRFVRELFEQTATINGMSPPTRTLQTTQAHAAALDYFELKRGWPYRDQYSILGAVVPVDEFNTIRRASPCEQLARLGYKVDTHPYDVILICLGTTIQTPDALNHARLLVEQKILAFAQSVEL